MRNIRSLRGEALPPGAHSILDRTALSPSQSSAQVQVDQLTERFVEEASDGSALTSMMAGGLAYRIGKLAAVRSFVGAPLAAPLRNLFASGVGLAMEVPVFEGTSRTLQTIRTGGENLPPNLWSWAGPGGLKEGLLTSFIDFALLKGFGHLSREQNIVLQHLVQDTAMVAGKQISGTLSILPKLEGTLAEQFLHAEIMNNQMAVGMGLAHAVTDGGIQRFERKVELSTGEIPPSPLFQRGAFFLKLGESSNSLLAIFAPPASLSTFLGHVESDGFPDLPLSPLGKGLLILWGALFLVERGWRALQYFRTDKNKKAFASLDLPPYTKLRPLLLGNYQVALHNLPSMGEIVRHNSYADGSGSFNNFEIVKRQGRDVLKRVTRDEMEGFLSSYKMAEKVPSLSYPDLIQMAPELEKERRFNGYSFRYGFTANVEIFHGDRRRTIAVFIEASNGSAFTARWNEMQEALAHLPMVSLSTLEQIEILEPREEEKWHADYQKSTKTIRVWTHGDLNWSGIFRHEVAGHGLALAGTYKENVEFEALVMMAIKAGGPKAEIYFQIKSGKNFFYYASSATERFAQAMRYYLEDPVEFRREDPHMAGLIEYVLRERERGSKL